MVAGLGERRAALKHRGRIAGWGIACYACDDLGEVQIDAAHRDRPGVIQVGTASVSVARDALNHLTNISVDLIGAG
jgi:hypothetical protein